MGSLSLGYLWLRDKSPLNLRSSNDQRFFQTVLQSELGWEVQLFCSMRCLWAWQVQETLVAGVLATRTGAGRASLGIALSQLGLPPVWTPGLPHEWSAQGNWTS